MTTPTHSAAFFDLDRTLISGSSAFVLAIAAWRADLLPTRQFARDAMSADRKSTRLNSSHMSESRMPSSA